MTKYIAFLRAINVAGHRTVKMADLNRAFAAAGCKDVRTVIQSGNVVFGASARDVSATVRSVQAKLRRLLGGGATVLFRTFEEIEDLVKAAPFKDFESDTTIKCYVVFLSREPSTKPKLPLVSFKEELEAFRMRDREIFLVSRRKPNGMYGFPNNFIEKELGVPATTRNWSTLNRIVRWSD